MTRRPEPRLWITYSWADDDEGDFAYLVQELRGVGINATYDKVALVPGRDLWAQIGDQITTGQSDGWAYLLTPRSLASEPCREELAYALGRALSTKGRGFPLIGLLHGVRIADVPPALRVRLCVSLATPNWREEVLAGLEGRPPRVVPGTQSQYVWTCHDQFNGDKDLVAIEVRPRFGQVMYWRFAVPVGAAIEHWGFGPAGGGGISGVSSMHVEGLTGRVRETDVTVFGAGDALSPGVSAYVIVRRPLPSFVFFGTSREPFGMPESGEVLDLPNRNSQT